MISIPSFLKSIFCSVVLSSFAGTPLGWSRTALGDSLARGIERRNDLPREVHGGITRAARSVKFERPPRLFDAPHQRSGLLERRGLAGKARRVGGRPAEPHCGSRTAKGG